MDVAERFSANLLVCRDIAGLSQEKLALAAELHRTEIGKLESGERVPRVDTLLKLAGAMRVDPCDLLKGMAWEPGTRRRLGAFTFPVGRTLGSDHG